MRHTSILMAFALCLGPALANPTSAVVSPATAPSAAPVKDLIQEGRAALKAGKIDEALALFEEADKASGNSPETHIWVLRTWMDQDRLNDAFNEADKLRDAGVDIAGLDYLYGYGSFVKANKLMREGAGGSIGLAFGDAVSFLQLALDRDEATFADAWVTLAHASWYSKELERAERAILKAVEHDPNSSLVHSVKGEIYFSLFKDSVNNPPEDGTPNREYAKTALVSFSRASDLTPNSNDSAAKQFAIWRQMGNVHAWMTDLPKASECFAEALSWDPQLMDYNMMWQTLAPKGDLKLFNESLIAGLAGYKKRFGENGEGAAMLLWWLGYGQLTAKEYEAAEVSFLESVERNKGYANSWFYVGLARYHRAQYKEACEGWLAYWDIDPASLVATIRGAAGADAQVFYAAGMVADAGYKGQDTIANLNLAERTNVVLAAVDPGNSTYWNNLGLLRRDIGEMTMRSVKGANADEIVKLYESSYDAYAKALTFSPNDPGYLNDAAVLLQYYLGKDLETARSYYERAQVEAQKIIDAEGWNALPAEKRVDEESRIRTALRDGADNLRKMDKGEVGTRNPNTPKKAKKKKAE